jgi:hypothetical protein
LNGFIWGFLVTENQIEDKLKETRKRIDETFEHDPGLTNPELVTLRHWLLASFEEAVPYLVRAFRFSGVLDYMEDAGVDRHAGIMRLLSNLLLDQAERSDWNKGRPSQVYDAVGTALSGVGNVRIKNAGIRTKAPVQVLTWCAFAEGPYLRATRAGWPGVVDKTVSKNMDLVRWIVNKDEENTTYSKYIDYLYDQFERRFDAVDIVFTDLIALGELWDRRLIDPADIDGDVVGKGTHGERGNNLLIKLGLERLKELGALVTINYHVPAVAKQWITRPVHPPIVGRFPTILKQMRENLIADQLFEYSADRSGEKPSHFDPTKPFIDKQFSPPETWTADLRNAMGADPYLTNKLVFAPLWISGLSGTSSGRGWDAQYSEFGTDHPVAPIQLAPGAHTTYTTFAMFANCGGELTSLLTQTNLEKKHERWQFGRVGDDRRLSKADIEQEDENVRDRGNRVLLLPDRKALTKRAQQFFNLLWHFVPAVALTYDHVTASVARSHAYRSVWFDPCLPVEAVLFHEGTWTKNEADLADAPASLTEGRLSCLGGYSFALSSRSFARERAVAALRELRDTFQRNLDGVDSSTYHLLDPSRLTDKTGAAVASSATRPTLSYWPLIDSVISDTVRLYAAGLFVTRALRAHCTAALTSSASYGTFSQPEQPIKDWRPCFIDTNDNSRVAKWIRSLTDEKIKLDILNSGIQANMGHEMAAAVLKQICTAAVSQFRTYLPDSDRIVNDRMKSLIADSDYVSGIVRSCLSIDDYASHLVETLATKVEAIAGSKHWAVYHVLQQETE